MQKQLLPPRPLLPGGHIAVLATSSPSEPHRIEVAADVLRARGFRVTVASNVGERHRGYLAGTDEERVAQLNAAFRNPDYDAFFFARGGYGAMRLLEQIDYEAFAANPRPLVGFSDITALHQAIAVRCGVMTFHGPMLNLDFHAGLSPDREEWLWSLLRGDAPHTLAIDPSQVLCEGEAEGMMFGGCLSLTTALTGTPFDFWAGGGIWFWEDVDEPVYRIDRMLTHLHLSGRLREVRGVVIGKLKGCEGESEMRSLLSEFFAVRKIPVVLDFPFGHHGDNLLMPFGAAAILSTRNLSFTITVPVVHESAAMTGRR